MMSNLAEALPKKINRVRALQDQYKECRGMPQVNVEPAILMMENAIRCAIKACAEGDTTAMIASYKELQGYSA